MTYIELLCRLIETPRYSREETVAADIVETYMKEHGMIVHLIILIEIIVVGVVVGMI